MLEEDFELLLVNPAHMRNVPGRKTDVQDAEWIADLLAHGLLRASYVPDRPRREVRELVRYRRSLVGERTAEVNRLHKVLEGANIKLGSVASDVTGRSGRAILGALLAGERDPQVLAELAKGQLRKKRVELAQALQGRFGPHQHFMLVQLLTHIDYLDEAIAEVEAEIGDRLRPFDEDLARLQTAPGIKR
ncbi:MAG: transposase, partial [Anaerolineales bacterium]